MLAGSGKGLPTCGRSAGIAMAACCSHRKRAFTAMSRISRAGRVGNVLQVQNGPSGRRYHLARLRNRLSQGPKGQQVHHRNRSRRALGRLKIADLN